MHSFRIAERRGLWEEGGFFREKGLEEERWRGPRKILCLEEETEGTGFREKEENNGGRCPPNPLARGYAPPSTPRFILGRAGMQGFPPSLFYRGIAHKSARKSFC